MTEKINNWWDRFGARFMSGIFTPSMVALIGVTYFSDRAENKSLQFSTPENKIKTEMHINHIPSDVDVYVAKFKADSIAKENLSARKEILEMKAQMDSLIHLRAVFARNRANIIELKNIVKEILYNQKKNN